MSDQPTMPRPSLLDRGAIAPTRPEKVVQPAAVAVADAVMIRTADALHRLERLAEAMEKVAEEGERQLADIRGRL
jgi:hypothetical protein